MLTVLLVAADVRMSTTLICRRGSIISQMKGRAFPLGTTAAAANAIVEGARPEYLNASNKPERLALVRRRPGTSRPAGTASSIARCSPSKGA